MIQHTLLEWVVFHGLIAFCLWIDLAFIHKKPKEESFKESLFWSVVWVSLSLLFNLYIYFDQGQRPALEFFTGYVIEKSLSVDNIFVFLMIFKMFKVDLQYQHRILFWGIMGALVMRGIMIGVGITLISHFHWIFYIFGLFLIWTAYGMGREIYRHEETSLPKGLIHWLSHHLSLTKEPHQGKFVIVDSKGKRRFTQLFLVLLIVEMTDVIFAIDSIPAIFAVTQDPFIVYTSNILAILGLRALFFLLAGSMTRFHYLKHALVGVLGFVGLKMLIANIIDIPIGISLGIIASLLGAGVVLSLRRKSAPLP